MKNRNLLPKKGCVLIKTLSSIILFFEKALKIKEFRH